MSVAKTKYMVGIYCKLGYSVGANEYDKTLNRLCLHISGIVWI